MKEIRVNLSERSYPIAIGHNCLSSLGERLTGVIPAGRALVISNPDISRLYGDKVLDSLNDAGYLAELFEIPEGESHKNLDTPRLIYDFLIEYNYPRQTTLIALGGGVVGDIVGFVAATYMRGVNYVQVPTSLLAMVDSSVGGKVGVNHPLGKNIIGAFYQPKLVFIDSALLETLPEDEFRAGFAEVIKYGIIKDPDFFSYLESSLTDIFTLNAEALEHIIQFSCEIKARVVEADERESGLRAILNFGHTIGHAVESLTNYTMYKHGEAIAIGMTAAAKIANKLDMVQKDETTRMESLIALAGLPTQIPNLDPEDVCDRLKKDKKVMDMKVRFVLPERIGSVVIRDDVPNTAIINVLHEMKKGA